MAKVPMVHRAPIARHDRFGVRVDAREKVGEEPRRRREHAPPAHFTTTVAKPPHLEGTDPFVAGQVERAGVKVRCRERRVVGLQREDS